MERGAAKLELAAPRKMCGCGPDEDLISRRPSDIQII